jgi:hypothetical protein
MSTEEQYLAKARQQVEAKAAVEQLPQTSGSPTGDVAPSPVLVPVGEIPLRLLEFRRGHKTTELGALGALSALLGAAALFCGLPVETWAYCQTAAVGLYIHSRGMAKQRRR